MGFDCGGQQWVSEVAFPCGTLQAPDQTDINYVIELLNLIESSQVPAPSPIEQRWTAASGAAISPAYSRDKNSLFSWVGIIMYVPIEEKRKEITESFENYKNICKNTLWDKYKCKEHWAKQEFPDSEEKQREAAERLLRVGIPVKEFARVRKELDPGNMMGNKMIDTYFPMSK